MPAATIRKLQRRLIKLAGYYPRVIKLVWEANPRYTLLAAIFSIAGAMVPVAQIWMSKVIVDRIVENIGTSSTGAPFDWPSVLAPVGIVFLVWTAGSICQSISVSVRELLGYQVRNYAEFLVLKKAARLDMAFFEAPEFYDRMENARRENYRAHNLAILTLDLFSEFISLAMMLGLLAKLHPAAVFVLLLTSVPQVLIGGYYAGRIFALESRTTGNRRMASYMSDLLGSREAVKEIRLFRLHDEFLQRFRGFWKGFLDEFGKLQFSKELATLISGFLSMAGTAAVWGYAVVLGATRRITVGDVALAFQAAEQGRNGLNRLFLIAGIFYEHTLFAGNFFSFLDLSPDSVKGALSHPNRDNKRACPVPRPVKDGIEFRNVSFKYPGSDQLIIKDLSFVIKAGESLAVVGGNGAGKTTFVKLLARFYDPIEGAIYLDGTDLREYDPDDLHREMGVIFQDFVRYNISAGENIGVGRLDFMRNTRRILRAAKKGGAASVIRKLPRGLNTVLGNKFDEGVDLSGGEWQKLALSRAFMREAQILILDEPTAALDAMAEYDIYERFAELTSGKTTIFISHRFSTVRMANHIIVLEDGRLIEEGRHDELMGLNGQYARMFNAQADRYR